MYRIKNNPGVNNESCSFDWSVTLCNKECLNNMQTSRIYLNQDNFQNRLFNGDILETSPMIHNSNITPYDYKHQIKFQIYNVYNEETDEYGTLTWTKNWLATSNDAMWLNSYWQFICINNTEYDSEQTYMSFNPNRNLGHRYIYIHNHFEWN
ncbi:MAG: hypothetical protein MJZ82_01120 [Paludibacteraceae bacterium]|nr:hypothetical protein [Paludibacteraceae bacterium]